MVPKLPGSLADRSDKIWRSPDHTRPRWPVTSRRHNAVIFGSLNIMLRVFSTPAPESSQFILNLQFSDPRRAPGELLLYPSIQKTLIKKYIFFDIVLSRMRYLGGFRSSRCHHPNPLGEIYNLGMVPELPELTK